MVKEISQRALIVILLLAISSLVVATAQAENGEKPAIEVANISGVSGYQIGIFGSDFGAVGGTVTVLGEAATITEWTDDFIRVTIPDVADGTDAAGLIVTTDADVSVSAEFTVYTIDSKFLIDPSATYTNVSFGKTLTLDGIDMTYSACSHFETGEQIDAFSFLTNYACRHDVGAKFAADESLGTEGIITIDLGEPVDGGEYLFQLFSRADWSASNLGSCPGTGYPTDYVIESSGNSILSGWTDPHVEVVDNARGNRSHYITLPEDTQFVRLRVTDSIGDCRDDIEGRDFEMKEVRLFQVNGDRSGGSRAFTIYGDSITANAFNAFLGAQDVNTRIEGALPTSLPFTPLGLSGRKASQLSEDFTDVNELADAFAEDPLAGSARFWGIALGTNDMNLSGPEDDGFSNPESQFNQFDESIEIDAVEWLIDNGRVPILARMHDTNSAEGGYGFLEAKIIILNSTDRIAAKYKLIPGPDMYTEFRLNIDRNEGNWIAGDGTHLANDGPDKWVDLWAESMSTAFDQLVEPEVVEVVPTAVSTAGQAVETSSSLLPTIALGIGVALLVLGGILVWRSR